MLATLVYLAAAVATTLILAAAAPPGTALPHLTATVGLLTVLLTPARHGRTAIVAVINPSHDSSDGSASGDPGADVGGHADAGAPDSRKGNPMCWMCDNPDATIGDYLDLVRETIDRSGWFVQGVEPDRYRPGFAYTVGLTALGRPELLVTGRPHRVAADLLNSVADHWVRHTRETLHAGDHLPLRDHPEIEVVDVAEPTVHLGMACNIYGPGVRAQQLVYADDRGRWPWDVGFRGTQPVLGPRRTSAA